MLRRFIPSAVLLLPLILVPMLRADTLPTAIAVLPFSADAGAAEPWLSKGLADLFIRHLAQLPSVAVVEREHMQEFLKEMELDQAPLFDSANALRAGRVARADAVLYGHYALNGSRITVTAILLSLATQRVLATEEASGAEADLVPLVRGVTQKLLEKKGQALTAKDLERLNVRVTDSVSAFEHFYRGIDAYDHGLYPDAWGEFFAASRQDARYVDAALWMGRLFEAMGQDDHAVLAYRDVFQKFPHAVEALDALLFAGRLLQEGLQQDDRALVQFKTVTTLAPDAPHALEAAFRSGQILERKGDLSGAYAAYRFIDKFKARVRLDARQDFRTAHPASHFFSWEHALSLYPDALTRAILLYGRLVDARSSGLEAPRGVLPISTGTAAYTDARFTGDDSLFPDAPRGTGWHEAFYAAVAPAGFDITGVDLEVTGLLKTISPNRDYTLRVLAFPMPRQYFNQWLGVIYGQTPQWATLRKTIAFHGQRHKIVMLQLIENGSEIRGWSVRLHLASLVRQEVNGKMGPRQQSTGVTGFYEGQGVAHIPVPADRFTGSTRDSTESFNRSERKMALLENGRHSLLISVQGELTGEATDLYASFGEPGKDWSPLTPLPINSAAEDYDPRLVRAEDGKTRLFWLSTRRGRGWELWSSELTIQRDVPTDAETLRASPPRRVPLEKFADPGFEKTADHPAALLEYDITQDQRGWWRLVYFNPTTQHVVLLRSRDLEAWEIVAQVPAAPLSGFSLLDDHANRLALSAFGDDGSLHLWSSMDGSQWAQKTFSGWRTNTPHISRTHLLETPNGRLTILATDKITGLQYAALDGQSVDLQPDLVTRCGIEAYAAAPGTAGSTLIAFERSEAIDVQRYRGFHAGGRDEKKSNPNWAIYTERATDADGNRWTRYFARERFRVPDVTSLAVEPDGRIWWGIETGIMSLKGDEFFATDVSQGFFNNDVSRILACPGLPTLLSSHNLTDPVLGWVDNAAAQPSFRTQRIPGAHGTVIGLACATTSGEADVETSGGDVWRGNPTRGWRRSPRKPGIDPGYGRRVTDAQGGTWSLANDDTPSDGVLYTKGSLHKIYNPPHDRFDAPSALALDQSGHVWIGTWFKGLYKLERTHD